MFSDAIMGLVTGDALGVPAESGVRGSLAVDGMTGHGSHDQPAGTWSDDSSMVFATLESLSRRKVVDTADIMRNFCRWLEHAEFTPHGRVFGVGRTTREAVGRFSGGAGPQACGGRGIRDNGNGALMRILPVALLPCQSCSEGDILAVAGLTHAHAISNCACLIYSAAVRALQSGAGRQEAVHGAVGRYAAMVRGSETLSRIFGRLGYIGRLSCEEVRSSGFVADTLEASFWCFLNSSSYRECVLKAVNLGGDTDTTAAVSGGLAGLFYGTGGESGIPGEWLELVARREEIESLCREVETAFA